MVGWRLKKKERKNSSREETREVKGSQTSWKGLLPSLLLNKGDKLHE
jgi:hypothetical protein